MRTVTDFLSDLCHGLLATPGFVVGLFYYLTIDGFKAARYALDKRIDCRIAELDIK